MTPNKPYQPQFVRPCQSIVPNLSFVLCLQVFPEIGIVTQVTALVCMSSMFSGATRAVLTSTVFALEVTGAHFGIAPLLIGNCAAYLISSFFLKETILTEKIARRGIHVPDDYFATKAETQTTSS